MRTPAESHFASQWMRISRRTLTGSPAPPRHRPKGSPRRHPRHPQSGGRGTSGSAAPPPSASVPATWQPHGTDISQPSPSCTTPGGSAGVAAIGCARLEAASEPRAEIKSCCRLASLLDVPLVQAAQNVVPVAVTAGDKIEGLRQWASGRCLSADRAGMYSRSEGVTGGRVRRVVREPGVN